MFFGFTFFGNLTGDFYAGASELFLAPSACNFKSF